MPDRTIPLVQEQAEIGKRAHASATVKVKTVVQEVAQPVEADLHHETVEVARVPVNRFVEGPVPDRREGDTLVISVLEEVLVVEKRLKVVEEIHLTRRRAVRKLRDTIPVRREDVRIEREET